jgi:hypothetical protein
MTGPEFAAAHGNDASTWSPADIECEMNLAEMDRLPALRFLAARRATTPTATSPADLTPAA